MGILPPIACLACLFAPSDALGASRPGEGLDWSVIASPPETLPWLPVRVTVSAMNNTEEDQPCRNFSMWIGMSAWLESDEGKREPAGGQGSRWSSQAPPSLKPGERYVIDFWFFNERRGGKGHHFPRPGLYVVHVTIDEDWICGRIDVPSRARTGDRSGHRHLPATEIRVVPPRGRDLEASRIFTELSSNSWWSYTPSGGRIPPDHVERLTSLAAEYKDTTYGKYARFRLACHYGSRENPNAQSPRDRQALRSAVLILERLDADTPPENIKREIYFRLASWHLLLGEREAARNWFERIDTKALPRTTYGRRYRPIARKLAESRGGGE